MGRKGGASKSERKAETARENGRRGGRPKKQKPDESHLIGCYSYLGNADELKEEKPGG